MEGVLTLEAHMGRTAEIPLWLYAPGNAPAAFTAAFALQSSLCFDVRPASGVLPPAPPSGLAPSGAGTSELAVGGSRRAAVEAGEVSAAAPLTVLYTCRWVAPT